MTTISEHRLYLLENGIVEPCADDLAGLIEELRDVRDKLDEAESRVRLWNDQTKRIEELEDENGALEERNEELESRVATLEEVSFGGASHESAINGVDDPRGLSPA